MANKQKRYGLSKYRGNLTAVIIMMNASLRPRQEKEKHALLNMIESEEMKETILTPSSQTILQHTELYIYDNQQISIYSFTAKPRK